MKNIDVDVWRQRFTDRKASGLTVKDWCSQNDVSKAQYYYWFRRIRILDDDKEQKEVVFAEIKKDCSISAQKESIVCGNLHVSWNGLQMQITDSNDARLAAELFSHLRNLC